MRVVSPLAIIASLVLYTNAAVVDKRAISTPVQTCINDINAISISYGSFSDSVARFVSSQGYTGMVDILRYEYLVMQNLTVNGIPHCCNKAITAYTDEEATAVIGSVSGFSSNAVTAMDTLKIKLPEVNKVALMRNVMKYYINFLAGNTTILDNCLVQRTPANKLTDINQYVNQISAAHNSAYAAYNATT